jgi:hypothetical protein
MVRSSKTLDGEKARAKPQKKPKDRKRGTALLNAIWQTMPDYTLDAGFNDGLPHDLSRISSVGTLRSRNDDDNIPGEGWPLPGE